MIREAQHDDIAMITCMLRRMVEDMAAYGGHAVSQDESDWKEFANVIKNQMTDKKYQYLMADLNQSKEVVGCTAGEIIMLGGVFAPKKILHISAVYVFPAFRRSCIASQLLEALMDWGRTEGCQLCDLNVNVHNPARRLYEKYQFEEFRLQMVRAL